VIHSSLCLFRLVEKEQPDGMMSKQVRPYLMDLGSTNGTFINVSPPVILLLLIRYTSRISNNIFYPVNIYVLIFFSGESY
jgi:hypothetical protein